MELQDICYYKIKIFDKRCSNCNGYPIEGCIHYTTQAHVNEEFSKFRLDDLEQGGGSSSGFFERFEEYHEHPPRFGN